VTDIVTYEALMRRCIELAKIARQRGDSPVGSLIGTGAPGQNRFKMGWPTKNYW